MGTALIGFSCASSCGRETPSTETAERPETTTEPTEPTGVEPRTLVEQMPAVFDLIADGTHVYVSTYSSRESGDDEIVRDGRVLRVALTASGGEPEVVADDEDAPEMLAFAGEELAWYSRGAMTYEPRPSRIKATPREGGTVREMARGSIQVGGGFGADEHRAWFSVGRELIEVATEEGTRRVLADLGRAYAKELRPRGNALFVLEERYPEQVRADRSALARIDLDTGARRDLFATDRDEHLRGLALDDVALYTVLVRERNGRVDPSSSRLVAISRSGGDARTLVDANELLGGIATDGYGVYFVRAGAIGRYDLATSRTTVFVTEPESRPSRLAVAGDNLVWMAGAKLRTAPLLRAP